jgi:lysophospholipase L1-like esterase
METSPLYGKKISLNGDSICRGEGFPGGYGKIIAERNSMAYQNLAISGATVTAETYFEDGKARHWICRTIDKMDIDSDYAIVEGGVNDASVFPDHRTTELGKLTDGYDGELDDTTFIGAFESMLKQLIIRFHGKKIGYIAVHKMAMRFSSDYGTDDNYYLAAKACCEKWGVPFLDLNVSVVPFAHFHPDGDPQLYELRKIYTKNGDGWHPNEAGYKKYYCDKIEAWLKTL